VVIIVEAGLLFTTFRDCHNFSMQNLCRFAIIHKYLEHWSDLAQLVLWARPSDRGSSSASSSDLSLLRNNIRVVSGSQFGSHPVAIVGQLPGDRPAGV
jgi:hypothetical protein